MWNNFIKRKYVLRVNSGKLFRIIGYGYNAVSIVDNGKVKNYSGNLIPEK